MTELEAYELLEVGVRKLRSAANLGDYVYKVRESLEEIPENSWDHPKVKASDAFARPHQEGRILA